MTKKIIIGFGLLWLFIWSTFGIFLRTQWNPYKQQTEAIAKEGVLKDYSEILHIWKHNETAWIHGVLSAMLVIIIGLILSNSQHSNTQMKIIGILLIIGTILTTLFFLISLQPVMILGDLFIIIVLFMTFGELFKTESKEGNS